MEKLHHISARSKTLILILGLWGLVVLAPAQRPFQYRYGMEQGLPEAEPDQILFSRKGELWCKYPLGENLSRFDGVTWTHYRTSKLGFPGGMIFRGENRFGIWWEAIGSVQPARIALFTPQGTWKGYSIDARGTVLWDEEHEEPVFIDSLVTAYRYNVQADTFLPGARLLHDARPGDIFHRIGTDLHGTPYIPINNPDSGRAFVFFGHGFKYKLEFPYGYSLNPFLLQPGRAAGFLRRDGEALWFENGRTWPIRIALPNGRAGNIVNHATIHPWKGRNENQGLIVQDPSTGIQYLYTLEGKDSASLLLSHIPSDAFPSFSQDPQGNWWMGTSTGLVRSDQNLLTFSTNDPEMTPALHAIREDTKGHIWFGGYSASGGFSVFDGVVLRQVPFDGISIPVLPGSGSHIEGTLYFFTERFPGIAAIRNGKLSWLQFPEHLKEGILQGYFFLPLSDGQVALGLNRWGLGIAQQKKGSLYDLRLIGQEKGMLLNNVITIAEDFNHRLWLGRTAQGLALYDPRRDTAVSWLRSSEYPERIGAMSLLNDEKGTLWIGGNNGLYQLPQAHRFDYEKMDVFRYLRKISLPGPDTSLVTFLGNTGAYIVAGTQRAVHFIDKQYRGPRPRIFTLRYERDIDGVSSEQNAILLDSKGYLWIGAQAGATRIDLQNLRFDTSATKIRLTEFQAGDALVPINDFGRIGRIPRRKRNLAFTFTPSGNTFLKDDLYFDIALVNQRGDIRYQRHGVVDKSYAMDYVPSGQYTLHITAYKHNVVSGQAVYRLKVPQNIDESPWFWLGVAALLLSIPFLVYRQRQRQQALLLQQRAAAEKAKREQDGLRLQALSNFFNPHFINNALHWVQSRYRKDPETTLVIGKLADNVEALYQNTQNGTFYHSLARELEIVQNYLAIQQVRFGEKLNVLLELPHPTDLPCMPVPALLLQIHTENAVEKGIRNREGAGQFLLRVRRLEDGCEIVIEDDGRGRPEQKEFYAERKGSTAVMAELIQLLNAYNQESLTVRYDNFIYHTPDAGPHGTRVVLFIPKSYRYEFSEMANPGR
ncbi:MAG: histidine kinase [Haliscomenobacter sp.]|nr:histidine kinase [Haliscomenobacter sp.]